MITKLKNYILSLDSQVAGFMAVGIILFLLLLPKIIIPILTIAGTWGAVILLDKLIRFWASR